MRFGLVIIDEFQRMPELFPILRVLADRPDLPARFPILGSASPDLVKAASESLAGRVNFIRIAGFSCMDVGVADRDQLWFRGGFPESYLSPSDEVSNQWRRAFIQTFLQRDLPNFGIDVSPERLHRFWNLSAEARAEVRFAVGIR